MGWVRGTEGDRRISFWTIFDGRALPWAVRNSSGRSLLKERSVGQDAGKTSHDGVPGILLQVMMEAMAKVAMQALTHNLLCCTRTPYISKPLEGLRRPIPQRLIPVTPSSHPPSH